ncbi:MAG: hypothetical protein AB7K04_18045 [Pseudorhodoplanes sp.]
MIERLKTFRISARQVLIGVAVIGCLALLKMIDPAIAWMAAGVILLATTVLLAAPWSAKR